jgi:sialate O-acetylesterase
MPVLQKVLLPVLVGTAPLLAADFRLAAPVSDHMVLQRDKPVAVWGFGDPEEEIDVAFGGQNKQAVADAEGRWSVRLDAMPASTEPRTLVAVGKGGRTVEARDVLVGEVWLGSGQSNMAMTVQRCLDFDREKAAANLPLIRHYKESSAPAEAPRLEGTGVWSVCSPDTVGGFSATLYFFGREVRRELGVPVGLINTSVGGTPIESWLSAETQRSDPATKAVYESRLQEYLSFDVAAAPDLHRKQMDLWRAAVAKARAEGKTFVTPPPKNPLAMRKLKGGPAFLFNGKVANLVPYTLRGMLWYQGEGNANSPELYETQLAQLVTSWRALWADELPFAWVQLPNYRDSKSENWPRMRESMMRVLALPKTGMAITLDVGDPKDIHPKNKQEVGRRLALWALGTVYDRTVPAISGPLPAGHTVDGSSITIDFRHAAGLKTRDGGPLRGFVMAGADRVWKTAAACITDISGETVVVSSAEVPAPVAVRYAWAENPDGNLINGAGLPATTFRTDDWPAAK